MFRVQGRRGSVRRLGGPHVGQVLRNSHLGVRFCFGMGQQLWVMNWHCVKKYAEIYSILFQILVKMAYRMEQKIHIIYGLGLGAYNFVLE